ncbi:hypothetical protein CI238_10812 [Colletotrichum incanum]|uniref:Uncharacterized protein n=1 Tax=Colletotrichum incanum TaxID=1573173 RepID=A0A161W3U6_COLIC|nr:hypothetical protein CI238_10812 [Colletotrichum incanum]OHW99439.1 hypothetical protein CSPAE12_01814 [Colletotrichum incanum]
MAEVATKTPSPLAKLNFNPILKAGSYSKLRDLQSRKAPRIRQRAQETNPEDLALPEDVRISPVACSEPFPLFTQEAIQIMRQEIFTTEVWENCLHSTHFAPCQLRGHCPKYAPFMDQALNDPKTLAVISKVAGIDLIPNIQYEVGNINISIQSAARDKENFGDRSGDNNSVTKWHYDAFPFVCVVMMSDATNMVGGETALKTGTGEILKVRGPKMGSAVILQGRYVEHQALAAIGGAERVTMITFFRPRDPCMKDDSVLTSIRPISDHSELYYQWTKYRFGVLQERFKAMLKTLEEEHDAVKQTDIKNVKYFLAQQEDYIAVTNREIVETKEPYRHWGGL